MKPRSASFRQAGIPPCTDSDRFSAARRSCRRHVSGGSKVHRFESTLANVCLVVYTFFRSSYLDGSIRDHRQRSAEVVDKVA